MGFIEEEVKKGVHYDFLIEVLTGDCVVGVIKKAVDLANNNPNKVIFFNFNTINMFVNHNHTIKDVIEYYYMSLNYKYKDISLDKYE